jgi:hypothetical protein
VLPPGLPHGWRAGPHGASLVVVMVGLPERDDSEHQHPSLIGR